MSEDPMIVEYAIRYCMTRTSYALTDGFDLAERHWHTLSDATRRDVIAVAARYMCPYDRATWPTVWDHAVGNHIPTTVESQGRPIKRLCDARLRVFYGDLRCILPHGHEGNHQGTSRIDSRYVWWTPTNPCPSGSDA